MGLDTQEVVLWAEDEFSIDLPDVVTRDLRTVGEFVDCISVRLAATPAGPPLAPADIHQRLARFLAAQFALPHERITLDARFIEDLGLDS
ncbi:MAG: hypothetical protein FIB06_01465 [Betaproteobacteria bacterium]|nr:hypothetical protein [Betaproteobacteria bacterium]